jgi:hypothetical protein
MRILNNGDFCGLAHVYSAIPISSYLAGHEMNMHKPKSNQALISGRHWLPWLIPHLEETIMSHVLIFLTPPVRIKILHS